MRFSLVTLVRSKAAWQKHHCPSTIRNIGNSRLDLRASNHHDLSFGKKCHPMCLLLGTRHVVDIYRHLVKVHTHDTPDQWYEYPAQRPWKHRGRISRSLSTWSGSCFSRFTFFLRCVDPHSGRGFLLPPHPATLWTPRFPQGCSINHLCQNPGEKLLKMQISGSHLRPHWISVSVGESGQGSPGA